MSIDAESEKTMSVLVDDVETLVHFIDVDVALQQVIITLINSIIIIISSSSSSTVLSLTSLMTSFIAMVMMQLGLSAAVPCCVACLSVARAH